MKRQTIQISIFTLMWIVATGCASTIAQELTQKAQPVVSDVNSVMDKLNKSTLALESYQADIEYKFIQPVLFDSQTLRKGFLYYAKKDGKPNFRVNFLTLQQDQEKPKQYIEQYVILDGSLISAKTRQLKGYWLVYIDHQIKEMKYYQLAEPAEPNKPFDVFELIGKNLPIVGFSRPEELKKQFIVSIAEPNKVESKDLIQVHLDIKPNSIYKDDYKYIDFWIEKKIFLPVKIVAVTTEDDIYEIKLLNPKINAGITPNIFDFTVPKGFDEPQVFPLKGNPGNGS
jgi:hypothetical protein